MIIDSVDKMNRNISPDDDMYQGNDDHYFGVAESALQCIDAALRHARRDRDEIKRILDLPCGYGRVLRILRAAFPRARIVACDILKEGVDFCASEFEAAPVYSCEEVKKIPLRENFDLIWVGSLFTHLDADRWAEFLSFFCDHLNPEGIFLFSVHGQAMIDIIRNKTNTYGLDEPALNYLVKEAETKGFAFEKYPHYTEYGISVALPVWVRNQLIAYPSLQLLRYSEKGWDNHHDVVSCIRIVD